MSGAATPTIPGILGQPSSAIKRKEGKRARKARRLTMLPDDIKNLIAVTSEKKRPPIQADDLYEAKEKSKVTLEIPLGGKIYQIKTPPINDQFLKDHALLKIVMEKFGEHALINDFMEEDVQEAMRGIMKYYMFLSNHTFTEKDLKMNLIFKEMNILMLSYIDKSNLFGHWIYNHWDNIIYFFKVGFVAEDNIRPTTSKNKAERIKRDCGLLVGYKTLKDEFTIVVDAVEFQRILESIAKGDMRSLGFEQNKLVNIPSDSEASERSEKTLKKVRTRRPPSLPEDNLGDDSDGDQGKDPPEDRYRRKSPG